MCAISGTIINNPQNNKYFDLLKVSEIRGQDGTGIAIKFPESAHFDVEKHPVKASKCAFLKEFELEQGDTIIGQNRLAIFGQNEDDQQPLVTDRFALVHNGNLFNFEELFDNHGWVREYKVDTEAILRYIQAGSPQTDNEMRELLEDMPNLIQGNWACLLLDAHMGYLWAFTNYKPLVTTEVDGNRYFFSTERIGRKVFEDVEFEHFGNKDIKGYKI